MKLNIVHEYDDENGNPTKWFCRLIGDCQFIWVDKISEHAYGITNSVEITDYLHVCNSLPNAKRWIVRNMDELSRL